MSDDEVSGSFRIRGERSGRAAKSQDVDPTQLALLLAQVQRQLEGLAGSGRRRGLTFGELAESWWQALDRVWPEKERRRFELLRCFWDLDETELSIRRVNGILTGFHKGGFSGAYVNKIRNTGKLIVATAIECGEWRGLNPFEKAKRLRQTKPKTRSVTISEARDFLPHLREDRFWLAFTMLSIGLRTGELFGLHKADVDLDRRELMVRRSHSRDETKTGAERIVYIPDELVPVLRLAMERSPSKEFVFGHKGGGQHRADTKLSRALQHAFRLAGMCTGYDYSCRRRGCGFRDFQDTLGERRCPECGFKLWAHGRPKAIRFYDLRHSCATLHKEAGCDPWVVERMLGHAQGITGRDYTHCSPEFQRKELNKLRLLASLPGPENDPENDGDFLTCGNSEGLVAHAGQYSPIDVRFTPMSAASSAARDAGLEPTTLGLEGRRSLVPPDPLTSIEAAQELGISAYTFREYVRTKKFKGAYRVGLRIRVPRSALEAFKATGGTRLSRRKQ